MKQLEFDWRPDPVDLSSDEITIKMNIPLAEDLLSVIKKVLINRKLTDLEDNAVELLIESLTKSLKEDA